MGEANLKRNFSSNYSSGEFFRWNPMIYEELLHLFPLVITCYKPEAFCLLNDNEKVQISE